MQMQIKSTPHAHTTFVDGASTPEQMVRSAIERGFQSLGFSEHGRQLFDEVYGLTLESEREYINEIARLRAKYSKEIAIYCGVERDSYSTAVRGDYEYVIGSVHYLELGDDHIAVDGATEHMVRLVKDGFGGDGVRMAAAYFDALAAYVEGYRPDIIGHFDLVRKHNAGGRLFDQAAPKYISAWTTALERMAGTNALLEINTGAIARGYQVTPYPELAMLRRWRELGGRIIISSDCHDADYLDCGYGAANALARDAGFETAWALNPSSGELFAEYAL